MNKAAPDSDNNADSTQDWSYDALYLIYQLSDVINSAENYRKLLKNFLQLLSAQFGATSAIIRLISEDDRMDLIASYNIGDVDMAGLQHTSIESSLFIREALASDEIRKSPASALIKSSKLQMLAMPVRHKLHTLGAINLFFKSDPPELDQEIAKALIISGQQLGAAIERNRAEYSARIKLVQEERNMIANELHDSLAQTLASLRFQVRILDETLQPSSEYMAIKGIEQVENSLDEAYTDLRELIAHCRAPIELQGLLPSIEGVVEKFREETGIHILFQCECQETDIPANMEINIYRIVQEALTNIKRHADAHIVRVLISCDDAGNYRVLIENDGKGFNKADIQSEAGRHLGLTIMQERAKHLGGELRIESEFDEGTRIELRFHYVRESIIDNHF